MKITRTSLRQIILTELGTSLTAPKKNIKESSRDGHWHDAGYEDGSDGLDPKYLDNMDYMAGHEMGEEDAEYDVERGNKPSAVQVGINDDPKTLDADDLRAMAKKLEKSKEYIPSHLRLKKDPMERAYARKEIVKDYMAWTKLTGQITPAASSVLATYLVDQGLDQDKEQISTLASDLQLDTADVEHELATAKAEYDAGGVESEEDNYERGFYRESKMKITRTRLSQLIKEEVNRVLYEEEPPSEPALDPEAEAKSEEKKEEAATHAIFVTGLDMMGITLTTVRVVVIASGVISGAKSFENNVGGTKAHIQDLMKKYPKHILKVDSESAEIKALEDTKPPA